MITVMSLDQEIDSVVNEIQQLFADASEESCTCSSNPEGSCRACSRWGKAQGESRKLIAKLIAGNKEFERKEKLKANLAKKRSHANEPNWAKAIRNMP